MTKKKDKKKHNEHYWETGRNGWTPSDTFNTTPHKNVKMSVPEDMEFGKPYPITNRKKHPVYTGVIKYFPNALMELSKVSLSGNKQHHSDKPLHWDKSKSPDHLDALMRHLLEADELDDDGVLHLAKVAWRALAALQEKLEE